MTNQEYVAPSLSEAAFNCPHCGAFADQTVFSVSISTNSGGRRKHKSLKLTQCQSCNRYGYWVMGSLVHPKLSRAPLPAQDMPEEAREIFSEARDIVNESPRGAAALLRLCTETILEELEAEGDSIYSMIGNLVKEGRIDDEIQKAYDTVRVFGNESVHPGTIDLNQDEDTAFTLFFLVNEIVRSTITRERQIEEIWEKVPEEKKEGIEQRDS